MSCIRRSFSRAISCAILISTAFADVVTLKNGEKIEGKILRETDQQVTMEVKVSASIFDERVIARAEIDHIDKVSPEMEGYRNILAIQPGTNSMSPAQYEQYVRPLEAYLKQFPNGGHATDVQKTINEFLAEEKRVEAGEVKLHGEWLNKEEAEKEKVQIDGLFALEHMEQLASAGDNIGALNTFTSIEKDYPGAACMPDAVDLAKKLIAAIKPALERAIPEQKLLKAHKEKGFAEAGPAERPEMIAAYKADMAQAEATAMAADKAGQWPPFNVNSDKLAILLARVGRESTRLAALPVDSMRKSVQQTYAARQKIVAGDFDAADRALKAATTLWPVNELAKRLTASVAEHKANAPKPSTATPIPDTPKPKTTPTPKPSAAITPAPTPVPDEPAFFTTVPGMIVVVVGIAAALIGVNVFKKIKARNSAAGGDLR